MPSCVTRIVRNDTPLIVFNARINCGKCGSSQLPQKLTIKLDTEEKVLAHLAEKAWSKHASCERYSSPPATSVGSKRADHPSQAPDSVRSPARGAAAVMLASGGLARVENTERRISIEISRCNNEAARELEAHRSSTRTILLSRCSGTSASRATLRGWNSRWVNPVFVL